MKGNASMSRKSKQRHKAAKKGAKAEMSPKTLTWRVHPFASKGPKSIIAIAAVLSMGGLGYWAFADLGVEMGVLFGAGTSVVLFVALHKFFLPTTYVLSKDLIEVKRPFRSVTADWERFRSFNNDDAGVLLSPYDSPTRKAMFRSLFLMFDESRKEEILDYLRRRLHDVRSQSTAV